MGADRGGDVADLDGVGGRLFGSGARGRREREERGNGEKGERPMAGED
jgi:hypothetical protein